MVLPYGYNQAADRGGRGRAFYERNLASIMGDPRYARYRQDAGFQDAARDYAALWVANAQQGGRVQNTGFDFSGVDLSPYRHNNKPGTFWREGYFANKGFGGGAAGGAGGSYLDQYSDLARRYFGGVLNNLDAQAGFYDDPANQPLLWNHGVQQVFGSDPNDLRAQYARQQYGRFAGDLVNASIQDNSLKAADFFASKLANLGGEFDTLDARRRGESPGLFGSGTSGRSVW